MQVACKNCGAQYAFDAAAIPAAGYDAQCAQCGHVFFVAPENVTYTAPVEAQISVACTRCHAVYQFPAAAIPPGGYDAQCTQCQAVFFVGGAGAASAVQDATVAVPPPNLSSHGSADEPLPLGAEEISEADVIEADILDGDPEMPSSGVIAPPPSLSPAMVGHTPVPAADLPFTPSDEPPAAPSDDDDDEAPEPGRRSSRVPWIVLGAVSVPAIAVVAVFFAAPAVFDASVGKLIGIYAGMPPEAQALLADGRARLFEDTEPAFKDALEKLEKARSLAPEAPEAAGLVSLARVLRAQDALARGRVMHERSQVLLGQLKGTPPKDREEQIRKDAQAFETQSAELLLRGGQDGAAALGELKPVLDRHPGAASLNLAAALHYTSDDKAKQQAAEHFQRSLDTLLGPGKTLDPAQPPDLWALYLQARLWRDDLTKAESALAAALKLEPRFQRARLELAELHAKQSRKDEAKRLLGELLATAPEHPRAKELLAALDPPPVIEAEPPPPTPIAKAKLKKKKKGPRRR